MIYIWVGACLLVLGLIMYLMINAIYKPYPGCSGAGMSGLPIAFLLMAALALMGLGLLILVIAVIAIILG